MHVIEVTISPTGETTIQTNGYTGSDCLRASKFLEASLGTTVSDQRTAEFYQSPSVEQHLQQ